MKIGAPIREVRIPIGISDGVNVLEMLSIKRRYKEPNRSVNGKSFLKSGPTMNLPIWGTARPTHPIIPEIETEVATRIVVKEIIKPLSNFGFSPREIASSSPNEIMFSFHLKK